jgi:hypothetical protein
MDSCSRIGYKSGRKYAEGNGDSDEEEGWAVEPLKEEGRER